MPPYPDFHGRINLADASVTDMETGKVYSLRDWNAYKQQRMMDAHRQTMEERDKSSDLVNAAGTKTWFYDDWFGVYPPTKRPNPWDPPLSPEDVIDWPT